LHELKRIARIILSVFIPARRSYRVPTNSNAPSLWLSMGCGDNP